MQTEATPPCGPMLPEVVRVLDFRSETQDIYTLALAPPTGRSVPYAFRPGQFNMLYAFGVGEVPIIPPPAAIANAIYDAVGVRLRDLPMNPSKVCAAVLEQKG